MLVVTVVTAKVVAQKLPLPPIPSSRLGVGLIALGLMLVSEFTFVLS